MLSSRLLLGLVAIFAVFHGLNAIVIDSEAFNFKSVAKTKCSINQYLDNGIRKYPKVESYVRPNACGQPLQLSSTPHAYILRTDTGKGLVDIRAQVESYTLKPGQTLDVVAKLYNTTAEQILKINPKAYAKPELIGPGYTLKIGNGLCPEWQDLTVNTNRTLTCPTGATLGSAKGWVGPDGGSKVGPFVWEQELVAGTTDTYTFKATNVGANCKTRYLGVTTKRCNNKNLAIYSSKSKAGALVQWQLLRAIPIQPPAEKYLSDAYGCVAPIGGVPGGYTFTPLTPNQKTKFTAAALKKYFTEQGTCTDGSIPSNKGTIQAACSQVVQGKNYAIYIKMTKTGGVCADGTKVPASTIFDLSAIINQDLSNRKITVLQVGPAVPFVGP
jgi:LysM repeat protein